MVKWEYVRFQFQIMANDFGSFQIIKVCLSKSKEIAYQWPMVAQQLSIFQ